MFLGGGVLFVVGAGRGAVTARRVVSVQSNAQDPSAPDPTGGRRVEVRTPPLGRFGDPILLERREA